MKPLLEQLAAYNFWANERLLKVALSKDESLVEKHVASSFSNIYTTFLHIWDAESIWWQRMRLHEQLIIPSKAFNPTMSEVGNGLLAQSKQWQQWVKQASPKQIEHVFAYQNSKKEQFKQPVYEVLMHLFNHGTYHRGQIVTQLHGCGVEAIPSTDFIVFTRGK